MHKQMYDLPPPWEKAVEQWGQWMTAGGTPATTMRLRRGHVRATARRLAVHSPTDVDTDMLIELAARHDWSNDHRRSWRTSLIKFWDFLAAGSNPATGLPKVPESKPKPRPATDRVWHELLMACGPRERLMARLACEAGLRRAEVSRVHTRDLIEEMDGWALIVRGKGDKQRIVPLPESLGREIAQGPAGYSPGAERDGYLFPGRNEGHLAPDTVGSLLADRMPPGWSAHKLRHRFATRAYAGSRNLRAVQEALGHASVATTQRYTLVTRSEVREAVEAASRPVRPVVA